ncbi:MAG: hypothetical protein IKS76_03870 [Paludibacteraceae bacterium]|nr:hypothetical protein [Paludibacteraceae bacterium]
MKNIATFNTIVAEAMDELNGVWEREEQAIIDEAWARENNDYELDAYEYSYDSYYLDSKEDGVEANEYDVLPYTYDEIKAMGRDERNAIRKACEKHLDFVGDDWDYYYGIYTTVCAVEDDEFRAENEDKVRAIFKKYFEGKTIDEIRNDPELYDRWGYYSDYHKDCFGYRPHGVVCGEYINPWDR